MPTPSFSPLVVSFGLPIVTSGIVCSFVMAAVGGPVAIRGAFGGGPA